MMTNEHIQATWNCAANLSTSGATVWVLSNGEKLEYTSFENWRRNLEKSGFWLVAIFKHGYRVDL